MSFNSTNVNMVDRGQPKPTSGSGSSTSPIILIVGGLVAGVFVTTVLCCIMVCKLKLYRLRKPPKKKKKMTKASPKKQKDRKKESGIQYTRSNVSDTYVNLGRWRNGYGSQIDVKCYQIYESDFDFSSELTTSTTNDNGIGSDAYCPGVMLRPPIVRALSEQEGIARASKIAKSESRERMINNMHLQSPSQSQEMFVVNRVPKLQANARRWSSIHDAIHSIRNTFRRTKCKGNDGSVIRKPVANAQSQGMRKSKTLPTNFRSECEVKRPFTKLLQNRTSEGCCDTKGANISTNATWTGNYALSKIEVPSDLSISTSTSSSE